MLHLIPARLHRAGYRLAHAVRRAWLRLRGGTVLGCSIMAFDEDGRVLLLRHSYGGRRWELPGGGRNGDEHPEAAARREFREETGCTLGDLRHLGQVSEPFHGATNVIDVFAGITEGEARIDGREIVDIGFFPLDRLPVSRGSAVDRRLALLDR